MLWLLCCVLALAFTPFSIQLNLGLPAFFLFKLRYFLNLNHVIILLYQNMAFFLEKSAIVGVILEFG